MPNDIDLYDRDIVAITKVMVEANERAARMRNTTHNLRELGMWLQDAFFKLGFKTHVDMSRCGLIDVKTGRTYPPEVSFVGRMDDPTNVKEFDHDEKRFEVLDSREKGEKYRGLTQTVNRPRNARRA